MTLSASPKKPVLPRMPQTGTKRLAHIQNVIAIGSGKGGVGKSTLTFHLAQALTKQGRSVGILDADIYGPSQPTLAGLQPGQKPSIVEGRFQPLEAQGLKIMSIGCLIDPDNPAIWRGPMVSGALLQLLNQSDWGALDYLLIDLPPGTGDIQLTLAQKVPTTGALVVSTPQQLSTIDANKALALFQKMGITVLGLVENTSYYTCTHCGETASLWGEGGVQTLSEKHHVPVLAKMPFDPLLLQVSDRGESIWDKPEARSLCLAFEALASQLEKQLDACPVDSNIVVKWES